MSRSLAAARAAKYHAQELALGAANYYTQADSLTTFWHGKLASTFGLAGRVLPDTFLLLAEGKDPNSGEVLVRELNAPSKRVRTSHRAAWDLTISAPKSISITAILGERDDVLDAHRAGVLAALDAIEEYAEARLGGNSGAETTRNLAFACFEHDTARPPNDDHGTRRDVQLHTHCLAFNMTAASDKIRSLQPRELFRSQKLATAVYRTVLADKLQAAGYEIEIDSRTGAPEIAGYSAEYLRAASQRTAQIDRNLAARNIERTAKSANRAVRIGRGKKKGTVDPETIRAAQLELAREYGDQHLAVIATAIERGPQHQPADDRRAEAHCAIGYGLACATDRTATTTVRDVLQIALRDGLGRTGYDEIKTAMAVAITHRIAVPLPGTRGPGTGLTTREMIKLERDCVRLCLEGRDTCDVLIEDWQRLPYLGQMEGLSAEQRRVLIEIANQQDRVFALQGSAGVGKTRLLGCVARLAEANGFAVVGLAPSGKATDSLELAGISARSLQGLPKRVDHGQGATLYVVDESSLVSTRMVHSFLNRLRAEDRVLVVGDVAQHESVEAGRMFAQLQDAGIGRSTLHEIQRQQDPELRAAVRDLAKEDVASALARMAPEQILEHIDPELRYELIASEYAKDPENTYVIAPTHVERREITMKIREQLKSEGQLENELVIMALDPRNDYTTPALEKAFTYHEGDVVRYRKGSRSNGLPAGSYARVVSVDEMRNLVLVRTDEGHTAVYDPSRLKGVEIYRERERALAAGDRVLVTLGDQKKRISKNTSGWIVSLNGTKAIVRFDDGRTTAYDLATFRHIDHGYVLTSHTAQSITAPRVLVHVDTTHGEAMINKRFAYVAVSRAVHDAVIVTDRKDRLLDALSREYGNTSALESLRLAPNPLAWLESLPAGRVETTQEPRSEEEARLDLACDLACDLTEEFECIEGCPGPIWDATQALGRAMVDFVLYDATSEVIEQMSELNFADAIALARDLDERTRMAFARFDEAGEQFARSKILATTIRAGGEEMIAKQHWDPTFAELIVAENLALGAWISTGNSNISPPCTRQQILEEALGSFPRDRSAEAYLVLACLRNRSAWVSGRGRVQDTGLDFSAGLGF